MKQKIKTLPDLLDTSPAHQEALKHGDDHFRLWERNVADKYKGLPDADIKADLQSTAFPYAVCFEHVIGDFNMGTAVRNANAFNAREVFYLGDKKWDRRSAVGVHNYTEVKWLSTLDELIKLQEQYVFVGIDCVPGAVSLHSYNIPANPLFIFGEEGVGLTPTIQKMCKDVVYIPQFGSVRSINVGTASGIVMHEFVNRYLAAKATL